MPKKSTHSTRQNAAMAPVAALSVAAVTTENIVDTAPSAAVAEENTAVLAASVSTASLPTATGGNNTTLDAATPIIEINDTPAGRKLSRIARPPNAKSFQAIVNELRSHPVAPPLNVKQRMLSRGLKPKSNDRDVEDTQACPPGMREEVAAAASNAAYSKRYRSESDDDDSEGGDTGHTDYGDSESDSDGGWGGRSGEKGGGGSDVSDEPSHVDIDNDNYVDIDVDCESEDETRSSLPKNKNPSRNMIVSGPQARSTEGLTRV
jgi:hypothetical protein